MLVILQYWWCQSRWISWSHQSKISRKILEQKFTSLPVDVSSLHHDGNYSYWPKIAESAHMADNVWHIGRM